MEKLSPCLSACEVMALIRVHASALVQDARLDALFVDAKADRLKELAALLHAAAKREETRNG